MFHGTISAIATPFKLQASSRPVLDFESLERLVHWQLQCGVDGLVVAGSTGEAATLDKDEKLSLIRRVVELVRGRVPVIAGTGTNNTHETVELSKAAKALKADGVLIVSPYYNKPTQEGLYQHFKTVAAEAGLPVVVYNIPARSVVEISVSTMERLAKVPGIVALKHSVDSASRLLEVCDAVSAKIAVLAGDDALTYFVMAAGGRGVISASATAIPEEMLAITRAAEKGDFSAAMAAQRKALPFINALFTETNPIPAKEALRIMGVIQSNSVRLPLVPAAAETVKLLEKLFSEKRPFSENRSFS